MLVIPDAQCQAILTDLLTTTGPFNTIKVHLFQNNNTPTRQSVLSDFTEATFDGYTAIAPAGGVVAEDPVLGPFIQWPLAPFLSGGTITTPNTIYGYYVTDSGSATLYWAELFASPVNVATPLFPVPVLPTFGLVTQPPA